MGPFISCNDRDRGTVGCTSRLAIGKYCDLNIDLQNVQVKADGELKSDLRTGRTAALPSIDVDWYRKTFMYPRQIEASIQLLNWMEQ